MTMKLTFKLTTKLTTGILAMALVVTGSAATTAVAQNPDAIDNARSTAKSLQQNQANPAPTKPAPGAPVPAVKPAAIPRAKPVAAAKPASDSASAASSNNQLQHVSVVPGANGVQIEISSSQAVTPRVSKLSSPARVLVELPETVIASSQSKIPVGSAGVKGVRIGMDGKTPPTTSIVVDLEKPLAYELTPGAAGKMVLTLHADGASPSVAKATPAPATKTVAVKTTAAKSVETKTVETTTTQAKTVQVKTADAKTVPAKSSVSVAPMQAAAKPMLVPAKTAVVKASAAKPVAEASKPEPKQQGKTASTAKNAAPTVTESSEAPAKTPAKPKPEDKKWAMNGKRDPFFSPVVQTNGSGCSTGKKCLEINGINLRGVVKSDGGFIAVVTNNLNKAYFLRENDPVFNGYVVKITGDSVVFQETIQDKLGKPFTREVVKRIFTPAV
jgi:Tfp pilus assembly protein PilP